MIFPIDIGVSRFCSAVKRLVDKKIKKFEEVNNSNNNQTIKEKDYKKFKVNSTGKAFYKVRHQKKL